ncbi:orotidine-5'-phosphate decarboxylase [Petrotoga sp. 9PWA.NaAc.5.4]|uniref:orotidine-5'-phosphate decarboxylase n=1 Tax=Petrotoga sp. 9PWA.NaAc.5.4 TaxID=1434328 RepID=UPI000CB7E82D|nr:orotidine-5'-phosphate decarboxylase [Petrotoga sp. 9PWA.NaAc.5.4]PNR95745.1 orotidine 5-phosphate decarboxylase [Petrotoga sp. 9PWA.NaAc.5.4]
MFLDKLKKNQREKNSFICVGLDSDIEKLPARFRNEGVKGIENFNKYIIDQTYEHVCAYKINIAFYEMLGYKGIQAFENTVEFLKTNFEIPVIIDAKRGDIANTAKAYAKYYFEYLKVDSITVNPLMGLDSLEPYLLFPSSHIFVLALTSNPGAKDFIIPNKLYLQILEKLNFLKNTYTNQIGAVIGATQKEYFEEILEKYRGFNYLIPGIGSQGGSLEDITKLINKGETVVINVSRSIIFSENPKKAILEYQNLLNNIQF